MTRTFLEVRSCDSSAGAASASKKTAQASWQKEPDVAAWLQSWFKAHFADGPERLVFIEEAGASTKRRGFASATCAASAAVRQYRTRT
jgi:hypothetical protein